MKIQVQNNIFQVVIIQLHMNPVSALQHKANNSPYYQYLGLEDSSYYCSAADKPKRTYLNILRIQPVILIKGLTINGG